MGVGQIDRINGAAPIRAGELVPLLTGHISDRMGLYIYCARRTDMPGRVRRFIDFALEHLKDSHEFSLPVTELRSRAKAFGERSDEDKAEHDATP
jgi:hypothetical protein